jgi:hypothetical protein
MSTDLLASADPLLPILLEECERIIQESLEPAMKLNQEQVEIELQKHFVNSSDHFPMSDPPEA